jgi:hypothetical protein
VTPASEPAPSRLRLPGMTQQDKTPDANPEPLERASGTIDRPIGTGEAQPGDMAERAAALGGPIDIFPTRRDRTGLDSSRSTDEPEPAPER